MKYYLIVGEASGDLHASHLMQSLKIMDKEATFRFFGGDLMTAVGGTRVRHYHELAYMGFIPVLTHLPKILGNMRMCKHDILKWQPDCVILVDYPGFNLKIAKYVKSRTSIPVYYYISPKIWAWKEHRIKNIKRDVDELFSILPFEVNFFEGKHQYPIHYVGNPTADEVREYLGSEKREVRSEKVIALLAGSRKQEIKDNLPVEIVFGKTYELLARSYAALVTSGTATLEACLFRVPQVVCYETPLHWLFGFLRRHFIKVKFISLVNLIADREVVPELVADAFSVANIKAELRKILEGPDRQTMLDGYAEVSRRLGDRKAPDEAARMIYHLLNRQQSV